MGKKNKITFTITLILIIVFGGLAMLICFNNKEKKVERITGLSLAEGMVVEELNSTKRDGEEFGAIKIRTNYSEKELLDYVSNQYGENRLDTTSQRPHHEGEAIWDELNNPKYTISAYFFGFRAGKKAKTKEVELYVATDQEGKNCLFVFY